MRRVGIVLAVAALLVIGTAVRAAEIPNGSFEDTTKGTGWVTQIQDWTVDPPLGTNSVLRAGIFQSFDGFTATDGDYFAIVTNRLQVDQGVISTQFSVPSDLADAAISFDYVYATRWDSSAGAVDPFTVTVTDTVTGDSWTYNVSDPTDPDLSIGSLSTLPFDGASLYDTGWQTFSIGVENLVGSTIQVEFLVEDLRPGMSAFFLDRVELVPEPGTIALFGVGLVGLTLYGRRRRKAAKA